MFFGEMNGLMFVFLIIFLASIAQSGIQRSYRIYSQVPVNRTITGAQVAADLLRNEGIYDVQVELGQNGTLSDHYDPSTSTIRLSKEVYYGNSIASVAIAAHEAGHAAQHAQRYPLFQLRSAMVPTTKFAGSFSWILIFLGFFMGAFNLIYIGIGLFAVTTVFQLVTLPVELNASKRALVYLQQGVLEVDEAPGAKKVLRAAAFTYLVSLLISVMYLMRYIAIFGRRR